MRALKPGTGVLCFRDRAEHDLTMLRSKNQRLAKATFAREDGTLAHYFTCAEVEALAIQAGLEVREKRGAWMNCEQIEVALPTSVATS